MSDEQWGPWINDADPKIGMYVQVRVENDYTRETKLHEGTIVSDDGKIMRMSPRFNGGIDWTLKEWRERKPKGLTILQDILREVEDDGGVGYNEREMEEVK